MSEGWIKLHRKLLDSRVFANEGLLKVWIYCLCRANHEKNYVNIVTGKGETEVEIRSGEFIFGRKSCSKDLGMNPSTLYKRMQKLEKMGNVNIQSNSHYSIVSICNWSSYQESKNAKEQAKEHASNKQVTGREQASNTDKNDNNVKNEKNNGIPSKQDLIDYFKEKGDMIKEDIPLEADNFINHYEELDWKNGKGNKIENWKRQAGTWNNNYQKYNRKRLKQNGEDEPLPPYLTNYHN